MKLRPTLCWLVSSLLFWPAYADEVLPVTETEKENRQTEPQPPVDASDSSAAEKSNANKKAALKGNETLRIRGRLQTRWELTGSQTGSWSDAFLIRRARLDGKWSPVDWGSLTLELELKDFNQIEARDIYGRVRFWKDDWQNYKLTMGYFKKPFSRLRLESAFDLLTPERGLLDRNVVRKTAFGGFGARDLGLMLSGEWKGPRWFDDPLKVQADLGLFNGLPGESDFHRDLVARVEARLWKGLTLAANSNLKFYQQDSSLSTALMSGADLKWQWGAFEATLEGAYGDQVGTSFHLWGSHLILAYAIPIGDWVLTPAVMGEVYDPSIESPDDFQARLAAALNLDINQHLRLVLSLEKIWQQLDSSDRSGSSDPTVLLLQSNLSF